MNINKFAKQKSSLFWDIIDFDALSKEAIVERILNYGDMDDVKKLISIIGIGEVARIFGEQTSEKRMRCNYDPMIKNYFRLYFNKYAQNTQRNINQRTK